MKKDRFILVLFYDNVFVGCFSNRTILKKVMSQNLPNVKYQDIVILVDNCLDGGYFCIEKYKVYKTYLNLQSSILEIPFST